MQSTNLGTPKIHHDLGHAPMPSIRTRSETNAQCLCACPTSARLRRQLAPKLSATPSIYAATAPSDFYHYSVLSLSPRAVRDGTQISNASAELKHLLSVHLASKWPTRGATRESRGLAPINRHGARDG